MGKNSSHSSASALRGVKKIATKPSAVHEKSGAPEAKKLRGLGGKDASSFLKQRLGQKVKNLRTAADTEDLQELQEAADKRADDFEESCPAGAEMAAEEEQAFSLNPGREAENSRKKFYTELRKVLASADVIIEVLDARDPAACRSEMIEKEVTSSGKRLILLLNKIDLVPKDAVEAWLKHLHRSHPAIAFKAAHGGASRPTHANVAASRAPEGLLKSTHAVVGADELMQLLKNYARCQGSKQKAHVCVGVVGYPNTGKSSVINSMMRTCVVETGGRAGVTKQMQEVRLDKKVTLIDSPGVVFEGSSDDPSVVLRNVVRVETVADPVGVVDALIRKVPRESLTKFYGLQRDFATVNEFLIHVAKKRGKLARGRGLDLQVAARSVISDWTTGKFRYYVLPPVASVGEAARAEEETAEVVTKLAPRFDIDALFSSSGPEPVVLGAPGEKNDDDVDMEGDGSEQCQVDLGMHDIA